MSRNRFLLLFGGCLLAASAAWADDVGYVDCSNHPEDIQVFAKPRRTPDVLASVPCGARFTILVYGFVFSRIQTGDGKVGYVYSNLIAVDRSATAAQQNGSVRMASEKSAVTSSTPSAVKPTAVAQPQPVQAPQPQPASAPPAVTQVPTQPQPAAATPAAVQAPAMTPSAVAPPVFPAPVAASPASSNAPESSLTPAQPTPSAAAQPQPSPAPSVPTQPQPAPAPPALAPAQPQPTPVFPPPAAAPAPAPAVATSDIAEKPTTAVPQTDSSAAAQPEPSAASAEPPAPAVRPANDRTSWEKPLPSARRRAPLLEFYGGYAFARVGGTAGTLTSNSTNLSGAMGSFGWNIKPWLQILGDSSYNVVTASGTKYVLYGNHFGPRYFYHSRNRWGLTPFAEALVGGSRGDTTVSGTGGYKYSDNCLSYKAGGGVDIHPSRHIDVRLFDFDYYRTAFGTNLHQNNYWVSTGIVVRLFGGGSE